MLPAAIRKKFSSRNCRLQKAFSTVIMLTTNLCHFSICFLHDRQQNRNVKRSEGESRINVRDIAVSFEGAQSS